VVVKEKSEWRGRWENFIAFKVIAKMNVGAFCDINCVALVLDFGEESQEFIKYNFS